MEANDLGEGGLVGELTSGLCPARLEMVQIMSRRREEGMISLRRLGERRDMAVEELRVVEGGCLRWQRRRRRRRTEPLRLEEFDPLK